MQRLTVTMLAMVVAVLTHGTVAPAASSAVGVTRGSFTLSEDLVWWYSLSGSWAAVQNDWTSDSIDEYLPGPTTAAIVSVTGAAAGASASTGPGSILVSVSASTGPGSSAAYAYAQEALWFTANSTSELTFALDYTIDQVLTSQADAATFADTWVTFSLYRNDATLVDESSFYSWAFAADGDAVTCPSISDTLFVGGLFTAGEIGYLSLRVDGQAIASVPAPGAILLGVFGTGLVGLWRRRSAG